MNATVLAPLVLVVDDDVAVRTLVHAALGQADFHVEEAGNGLEALAAFSRLHPDIVLLDVNMPGLDGFDLCAEIRSHPGGADVPVVFITALEDVWSIQHAYDVGATDFITKPIEWLILSQRVRYILRANKAMLALRNSERKLMQAQRIAKLGHWEWDLRGGLTECAEETLRIFDLAEAQDQDWYRVMLNRIHPDDQARVKRAIQKAQESGSELDIEYRIVVPGGTEKCLHCKGKVIFDEDSQPSKLWGMVQDITDRKRAEERIRYLAYYDSLTGLPNRLWFEEATRQMLRLTPDSGGRIAIFHLGVDRFSRINRSLGHPAGDRLLKIVAQFLTDAVRGTDFIVHPSPSENKVTVARFGGDEFTLTIADVTQVEDALRIARLLLTKLAQPILLNEQEIFITASIGVAVHPEHGEDTDTLLKNANSALAQAKKSGGNTVQFYSDSMNPQGMEKLTLESQLKQAIERAELVLYYQPQIDILTGALVGLEALSRWPHPQRGFVPPMEFIPLAEESDLILALGEWALYTACQQAKDWQAAGFPPFRVAVNLSARQFRQPGLIQQIARILEATGLPGRLLELEITESVIMDNVAEAIATLEKLKEMEVSLAIDDFGTGYSSLNYLKRFPVDKLKIDQSFVREATKFYADAAIARVIVTLAHSLGLRAIAEGVETEQQLAFLREHACDECQGYFFGKPAPAEEIRNHLPKLFNLMP